MLFIIISDLFSEKGVDGAIGMPFFLFFFHVWCVHVCVCVCVCVFCVCVCASHQFVSWCFEPNQPPRLISGLMKVAFEVSVF